MKHVYEGELNFYKPMSPPPEEVVSDHLYLDSTALSFLMEQDASSMVEGDWLRSVWRTSFGRVRITVEQLED